MRIRCSLLASAAVALSVAAPSGDTRDAAPGPAAAAAVLLRDGIDAASDQGIVAYGAADGHIWIVASTGRGARRVTSSPVARDFDPSWSPDGRQLVFKSVPRNAPSNSRASSIVVVNLDGSNRHSVSPPRDVEEPSWSPNGTQIAFQFKGRLALVQPDGGNLRVLAVRGGCPSWSPDSRSIAICGDDGEIYMIQRDGRRRRRLTHASGADVPGPWAPDGTRLSFLSERDGDGDVYVMRADGSRQRQLTNFPGAEAPNAWIDSGEIVFPTYRAGGAPARWFAIRADGSGLRRLRQLKIAFDPIDWLQ